MPLLTIDRPLLDDGLIVLIVENQEAIHLIINRLSISTQRDDELMMHGSQETS
jgi:hypothetical protein